MSSSSAGGIVSRSVVQCSKFLEMMFSTKCWVLNEAPGAPWKFLPSKVRSVGPFMEKVMTTVPFDLVSMTVPGGSSEPKPSCSFKKEYTSRGMAKNPVLQPPGAGGLTRRPDTNGPLRLVNVPFGPSVWVALAIASSSANCAVPPAVANGILLEAIVAGRWKERSVATKCDLRKCQNNAKGPPTKCDNNYIQIKKTIFVILSIFSNF